MGTSELSRTLDEMLSGREGGEVFCDELASQKENLQYFNNSLQATETREGSAAMRASQ